MQSVDTPPSPAGDEDDMPEKLAGTRQTPGEIVNRVPAGLNVLPQTPAEVVDGTPAESKGTLHMPMKSADDAPPPYTFKLLRGISPFWHDRLLEAGLILSMGLYYLVGNVHLGAGDFLHLPPYLYSFPFLAIFACLSWYRLPFALALLPLTLPYYYMAPKTVFSHYEFSLIEISLYTCVLVAVGQLLVRGRKWRYLLTWAELRDRLGWFIVPILVFCAAALVSVVVAVDRQTALRAFREEVIGPLIYLLLALCCLRTRQDVKRLLFAFLGCALVVAFAALIQYFFFPDVTVSRYHPVDGRAHAMYGSANSIGLFFDYALPLGIALFIFQFRKALRAQGKWWICVAIMVGFVPMVGALYFSQSLGSALALPVALLFIVALSMRNRRVLLISAAVLVVLVAGAVLILRHPLVNFIENWHDNSSGISTVSKRYYLWVSAWHMIQDYPVLGVGMDNWLCHYSPNTACLLSQHIQPHYWVTVIPGTNSPTGLSGEPTLSHPHDIFLQVWVSIGIFGLLAFGAILGLFYWLFARILKTVRRSSLAAVSSLEWIVVGVGGAMLAALCQGLIDSSFLEQDLAFCFWMLVSALLILRVLAGTAWRRKRAD